MLWQIRARCASRGVITETEFETRRGCESEQPVEQNVRLKDILGKTRGTGLVGVLLAQTTVFGPHRMVEYYFDRKKMDVVTLVFQFSLWNESQCGVIYAITKSCGGRSIIEHMAKV